MDCGFPGSSVHRALQARTLDQVAILFSRDWTWVSCMVGNMFTISVTREACKYMYIANHMRIRQVKSFIYTFTILKDTCTPVFIAALFTIARTWKQPRCPSRDEWIKKMWYKYTVEYCSAVKENKFELALVRWMNLEPVIQSEVSHKEKNKYYILTQIYEIYIYIWNLEKWL